MISLTVTLSLKLGRYSASFIGNRPPFTVSIDKNPERTRSSADRTDVISGNRAAAPSQCSESVQAGTVEGTFYPSSANHSDSSGLARYLALSFSRVAAA